MRSALKEASSHAQQMLLYRSELRHSPHLVWPSASEALLSLESGKPQISAAVETNLQGAWRADLGS